MNSDFVAGYLAAADRVADGDAAHPDDADTWVPDLDSDARAAWVEGFRAHFESDSPAAVPHG